MIERQTEPAEKIDWGVFREEMPVARQWAYLDHAAVAPISGPAHRAITQWNEDATANGDAYYQGWMRQLNETRQRSAQLINAQPEEIALVPNTTAGISLVAEGYPWKEGDNVVLPDNEFPSNQYPWLNLISRNVEIRRIPAEGGGVPLEALAQACDARTRIVSVSWVAYASGWRQDLDRLAEMVHGKGALLFLDAIQGLGVFPLDVRRTPIDFLASDGHKWLLGPEGAGIFYLRREHLDLLRPIMVGWNSVAHDRDFTRIELNYKNTAERYEGGSMNVAGFIGLNASLELLLRYGQKAIAARVLEITDLACSRLTAAGAIIDSFRNGDRRSGIVSFRLPGRDPDVLRKQCLERQVVLSCRAGRLRISPHAYNDGSDIDRLIEAIRA
ncbi:MAG: aminotransferase class V-fold PLP-dependent enzyme [Planctomycetota bacterium]